MYNSLYGGLTIQFLLIPDETLMKHKKYLLLTCKIMRCMYKSQVALLSLIPRLLVTSSLVSDRPAGGKLLKKECFFTSLCHIKYKWRKDDIHIIRKMDASMVNWILTFFRDPLVKHPRVKLQKRKHLHSTFIRNTTRFMYLSQRLVGYPPCQKRGDWSQEVDWWSHISSGCQAFRKL